MYQFLRIILNFYHCSSQIVLIAGSYLFIGEFSLQRVLAQSKHNLNFDAFLLTNQSVRSPKLITHGEQRKQSQKTNQTVLYSPCLSNEKKILALFVALQPRHGYVCDSTCCNVSHVFIPAVDFHRCFYSRAVDFHRAFRC